MEQNRICDHRNANFVDSGIKYPSSGHSYADLGKHFVVRSNRTNAHLHWVQCNARRLSRSILFKRMGEQIVRQLLEFDG